jgi:hypothetical protein
MQHIILRTPYIAFMLVSHTCIFAIDHVEQGPKEPPEPAPVEEANIEQEQGKTQCIKPPPLSFCLPLYLNYDSCLCIKL